MTYSESGYLHPTQARGGFGTAGLVRSEALLWSVGRRWPADGWAPHSGERLRSAAGRTAAAAALVGNGNTHAPDVVATALAAHPRQPLLLSGGA